jgi:hypothetical protein
MSASGKIPFLLAHATLTLYPTTPGGAPILSAPVWFGSCEEGVRISERWITAESFPAGRRYPTRRALVAQYQIAISRLWVQQRAAMGDFQATHQRYVLTVFWEEEDGTGYWHRKTYYGVTISDRTWQSTEVYELRDEQVFSAEYCVEESGAGSIPAIAESVPLTVRWVGADGVITLYTYNATTKLFTAVASTAGRATLVYVPDQSGVFRVVFNGVTTALEISGEEVRVGALIEDAPPLNAVPRMDFMVGQTRVASVTAAKEFYALTVTESDEPAPATVGAAFELLAGSDTVLVLELAGANADDWREVL